MKPEDINGAVSESEDSNLSESSESEEEDEEEEEAAAGGEVIMKEFMAAVPSDDDLEGMEILMKQLMKHMVGVDFKEFAKILLQQNYVTTLMKATLDPVAEMEEDDIEEDEQVYGLFGIINLKAKKDNPAVKQLVKLILELAGKSEVAGVKEVFEKALGAASPSSQITGLLVKEKIINIPGVATPPFMHQLRTEMRESTLKGMPYDITHFIHVAKLIELVDGGDIYFVEQDDEIIQKNHLEYMDFSPVHEDSDDNINFQNHDGAKISGRAFQRFYIFTEDHMQEYMRELSNIPAVRSVMAEAHGTGMKY